MDTAAGVVFLAASIVVGLFQIALAFGAPWGAAAYGGQHEGVLPSRFRWVSGFTGFVLYPLLAAFVIDAAGVIDTGLANGGRTTLWLWVIAGFFALGTLANLVSRSPIERWWALAAFLLAISSVVLAL